MDTVTLTVGLCGTEKHSTKKHPEPDSDLKMVRSWKSGFAVILCLSALIIVFSFSSSFFFL